MHLKERVGQPVGFEHEDVLVGRLELVLVLELVVVVAVELVAVELVVVELVKLQANSGLGTGDR